MLRHAGLDETFSTDRYEPCSNNLQRCAHDAPGIDDCHQPSREVDQMSKLIVMSIDDPSTVVLSSTDPTEIAADLATIGVDFEQWETSATLSDDADAAEILDAFADDVERIREQGYDTIDVVRMHGDPDDPELVEQAAQARKKFLSEHIHTDDEVRFFVDGRGAFYLRAVRPDGVEAVHVALCEQGDYISVPQNVRHWFDMGTAPNFAAIRFFKVPDGWVGDFTGDSIAHRFPTFDDLVVDVA